MLFYVPLPKRPNDQQQPVFETTNNIVLIGANGSGKTRLGVWLENQLEGKLTVHRISAQKALTIPEFAELKSLYLSEREFLLGSNSGYLRQKDTQIKKTYRWSDTPATAMLDDYSKLLSLLFAKAAERDKTYTQRAKLTQAFSPVVDSPIEIIIKIWSELLPHRSISFDDGKVLVGKPDAISYHGKEMSDGERVILYLIGQCLSVPDNSVIIIDEPEVHIHKSIIAKLWDIVEGYCQNKLIIYITHDLEFASSRVDASKYWIKSYEGNDLWDWESVPTDDELPETLLLEILGNRKPVIFCEGEKGKLDSVIYQLVYPTFHVIPRAGGDKVIESTKAFRGNASMHHLRAFGIIDSDYKEDAEKQALLTNGVHTLAVAEIENLLCIEPILRIVATHQGFDPDSKVEESINFLIKSLLEEFDTQVSAKAQKKIEYMLQAFSKKEDSEQALVDALNETITKINVHQIYEESRALYQDAIDTRSLEKLLLVYNRKSLLSRISPVFGLVKGGYEALIIRLLKGPQKQEIADALMHYLPTL